MITIKLSGGLGNQLFQYAYGYQMAKKIGTGIILDISWFEKQNLREPEILKFSINYDEVDCVCKHNKVVRVINNKNINRALRVIGFNSYKIGGYNYLKESRYKYTKILHDYARDNSFLDGYWQCPKYFSHIRLELLKMYKTNEISPGVKELGEIMKKQNSIAIHVRRGDYPQKKQLISRLIAINDDYYNKAVKYMLSKVNEPIVYVFSNDMIDALDMLKPILPGLINNIDIQTTALDEWYLMKCCRNQIIGNSTFSWWAAYLNEYKQKVVIAPNKFWGNDNILPHNWIKVNL